LYEKINLILYSEKKDLARGRYKAKNPENLYNKGFQDFFVGAARFELATSTSQMWRDDRATLRPEKSFYK
jgi:hypothetical protein